MHHLWSANNATGQALAVTAELCQWAVYIRTLYSSPMRICMCGQISGEIDANQEVEYHCGT